MNPDGKPYAGNPHVRFGEGLLGRTSRTAGWGLLNRRGVVGASRKRRLPSEMKGVHPEEKSSETGSEAPCVMPRGVRQKRSQNVVGRKPTAAKLRAVTQVNPDVAS